MNIGTTDPHVIKLGLAGTNQVNITNDPSDDRDPAWCCQTPITKEPFLLKYGFIIGGILIILIVFVIFRYIRTRQM